MSIQHFKRSTAKLFIIVGNELSGKEEITKAVIDLGSLHAQIITKYTTRKDREDDGHELICNCTFEILSNGEILVTDPKQKTIRKICDIVYKRNNNQYGVNSVDIWEGLRQGLFQVITISEVEAINKLREHFGSLVTLIYTHSYKTDDSCEELQIFCKNFDKFDHVLIFEDKKEDLYDQLFRLFRAYEQ